MSSAEWNSAALRPAGSAALLLPGNLLPKPSPFPGTLPCAWVGGYVLAAEPRSCFRWCFLTRARSKPGPAGEAFAITKQPELSCIYLSILIFFCALGCSKAEGCFEHPACLQPFTQTPGCPPMCPPMLCSHLQSRSLPLQHPPPCSPSLSEPPPPRAGVGGTEGQRQRETGSRRVPASAPSKASFSAGARRAWHCAAASSPRQSVLEPIPLS